MIARILSLFRKPDPSASAWDRFQAQARAAERRAQASHGRVSEVRAARMKAVHDALSAGRKA